MADLVTSVPGVTAAEVLSLMPLAADVAPPAVGDSNVKGTNPRYAREDHTHKSSVQRSRVSVPLTAGRGTAVFKQAYAAGMTDDTLLVVTEPVTPDQTGYTYTTSVIPGTITSTGFDVRVYKLQATQTLGGTLTALLGMVLNILVPATGTVDVKYIAAPMTV